MFAAAPLLFVSLVPQGRDDVLATFVLEGRPTTVSRTDVALEMARHLRRRQRGTESVSHLVDTTLIRRVATERGLMPTAAEVQRYWADLQQQLRAAGKRPEEFAAVRNTSEAQWLDDVAVQMAHERIVRAELGLSAKEAASADLLSLWLQEQRKQTGIVVDPDTLPPGTAARVGATDVPVIDLGMLLLRTAEDAERQESIGRVVLLATLDAAARREGVELTAADLDAAIAERRDDAARDPRYRGVTFENLLQAEGLTVAALRELGTFRAQVLLDKLAARRFPDDALAAELAKDRQAVLDRVGPRRRIGLIFVRATAEPNGLIPRDFDAAVAHLATVRERLAKETFANVARIESEHAPSKMQGGDTGWHHRRSERLPEPMLAAAFALPASEVSMPLRTDEGCFLVKVLEAEGELDDAALLERLRESKARELRQQLLADANIEFAPKDAARK